MKTFSFSQLLKVVFLKSKFKSFVDINQGDNIQMEHSQWSTCKNNNTSTFIDIWNPFIAHFKIGQSIKSNATHLKKRADSGVGAMREGRESVKTALQYSFIHLIGRLIMTPIISSIKSEVDMTLVYTLAGKLLAPRHWIHTHLKFPWLHWAGVSIGNAAGFPWISAHVGQQFVYDLQAQQELKGVVMFRAFSHLNNTPTPGSIL